MDPLPSARELSQRFTGFLFDLDGTLLDSMDAWVKADESFLGKRGFKVTPDYTQFVKTNSVENSALYTIERFGLDMRPEDVIKEWHDFVKDEYAHKIKLKEGAAGFLKEASESGITLGAATALDEVNAESSLKNNGIFDLFTRVYTLAEHGSSDDITSDKTRPEFYQAAAKACGMEDDPKKIIVFDDVPDALRAAKLAGYAVCGVYDKVGTSDMSELDFCDWSIFKFPVS